MGSNSSKHKEESYDGEKIKQKINNNNNNTDKNASDKNYQQEVWDGLSQGLNHYEDETTECPVCLENYNAKENSKTKSVCGHCFCLICFEKIHQINPLCPLCRKKLDYFDLTSGKDVKIINPYEDKDNDNGDDEISKTVSVNTNINTNVSPNQTSNQKESNQQAFGNWNIGNVRAVFSLDPFFNRDGRNHFDRDVFKNDPFFQDAKKKFENMNISSFDDPFFKNKSKAFDDPFFKNKSKAFDDPFFKNKSNAFDDPFFKNKSNAFNDPFFKNSSSAFNDPFFQNSSSGNSGFGGFSGFKGFN